MASIVDTLRDAVSRVNDRSAAIRATRRNRLAWYPNQLAILSGVPPTKTGKVQDEIAELLRVGEDADVDAVELERKVDELFGLTGFAAGEPSQAPAGSGRRRRKTRKGKGKSRKTLRRRR